MTNTIIDNELVAEIVSTYYNIGNPTNCELIRAGFNHNYCIETTDQKYVLRIYLNDKYYIRDADDFRFELDLLNFLLAQGLQVARPVANKTAEWLTTHHLPDAVRHMALFHFAPGVELNKAAAAGDFTSDQINQIGEIAARIHQATDGYQSQYHRYHLNLSTYLLYKPLDILETHLVARDMGDVAFFRPFAEKLHQQVSALSQAAPTYGLIHADLHGDNIFFDAEAGLTVIDFDHCAYGWRVYEIAPGAASPEVAEMILAGYESVRPLSALEKELIPTIAKLREIWDIGDTLAYQPLWGETPTDEYLENCVEQLRSLM